MIYTPLKSLNKPELSLGVQVRTPRPHNNMERSTNENNSPSPPSTHDKPSGSSFGEKERQQVTDNTYEDELTEVEYPICQKCNKKASFPDTKIKINIEVIGRDGRRDRALDIQHRLYNSHMTKSEILNLVNEEIKLDVGQQINLVDMIEQAAKIETGTEVEFQEDWEAKADEIRSELKKICIEIESKGLAECRQTVITSHKIEMTDNKPIRHKVRSVPYHCRKEFEQIIKDQLAAGIIRPSNSATCSPVNLVLKEDGSLRLTIDYRKVNNATLPYPYLLPRIDDIIARLAKNRFFSKIL